MPAVINTMLAQSLVTGAFDALCSALMPVQSPENLAFRTAVGASEAKKAIIQIRTVRKKELRARRIEGKIASAQGSKRGRLLVLEPLSRAAAKIDVEKSPRSMEPFARSAKAIAASANTAPNKSLLMLPACKRKQ